MRKQSPACRQRGLVMATALMFLVLLTLSAALAPRVAMLDLARASAVDAWSRSDAAAGAGLAAALRDGSLSSTVPGPVSSGNVPGAVYAVHRQFLGFRSPANGEETPVLEWHFLLSSTGRSNRGARATHAAHLMVIAPAPADEATCLTQGCAVPPVCVDPPTCESGVSADPVVVAWHLPETEE